MKARKMGSGGLERLVKGNKITGSQLRANDRSEISGILDRTIECSKHLPGKSRYVPGGNITRQYDYWSDSDKMTYRIWYFVDDRKIYKGFLDPAANVMDPGKTHDKEVTRKEFLEWLYQNTTRITDFVHHAKRYVGNVPMYSRLAASNGKDREEASIRYP